METDQLIMSFAAPSKLQHIDFPLQYEAGSQKIQKERAQEFAGSRGARVTGTSRPNQPIRHN